jgi:hypothetical protein
MKGRRITIEFLIGTMIEVPRAALTAGEVATEAEFFSFGTNDLTQMTFGYSRDDIGKFLHIYIDARSCRRIRSWSSTRPAWATDADRHRARAESAADLKLGICGEHGGEPSAVAFCHGLGFQYVSCSRIACRSPRGGGQAALADVSGIGTARRDGRPARGRRHPRAEEAPRSAASCRPPRPRRWSGWWWSTTAPPTTPPRWPGRGAPWSSRKTRRGYGQACLTGIEWLKDPPASGHPGFIDGDYYDHPAELVRVIERSWPAGTISSSDAGPGEAAPGRFSPRRRFGNGWPRGSSIGNLGGAVHRPGAVPGTSASRRWNGWPGRYQLRVDRTRCR